MIVGSQMPRVRLFPTGEADPVGDAVLELVDACGIVLDRWQEDTLRASLLMNGDRWAAGAVGVSLSRQNGKSELALARLLGGLFVVQEPMMVYTAHLADTSKEMFRRLDETIDSKAWLAREVGHVWRTNGHESIELRDGRRVRFRTRTKGGGRGYAGVSTVIFDEAMEIAHASHGAILPILSAGPNPQAWYLGSAVDELIHEDGQVFAKVRERGLAGRPGIVYVEFSLDYDSPDEVPREVAESEVAWAETNPAFGVRMHPATIREEYESLTRRTFAVERLGVGAWPRTDVEDEMKIDPRVWATLVDAVSTIAGRPCLAFDVSPERSAAISAAGYRPDGLAHLEVVDHRAGTRWVSARLRDLVERHDPCAVVCDKNGPAGSLVDEVEALGVKVEDATASEHARGCGQLVDLVEERGLRHLGTSELAAAVAGAATRPLGDAWAWKRRSSTVDISPLVAVTLALWGLGAFGGEPSEPMVAFR